MDKINLKILRELDINPRISFTQLGKATRVSKEVAQYRFKQLIKEKIITGFFAFVSTSKLGYQTNKILIKFKSVDKKTQDEIINAIQNSKIVAWAALCEGTWDLILTTISPSSKEFIKFYSDFFKRFGKEFNKKELLLPINNLIFNDKYLFDGKLNYNINLEFHLEKEKIDDIDKKILTELSLNSRIKFTEIAKKLSLTSWAITQRYRKLIKKEIILLLKPRIDFRKLGYSYYHLFIELNDEEIKKRMTLYYTQHKNCIMLMNHIGKYSMHLEFIVEHAKMNKIILDLREKFGKKIIAYEPLLIVKEYTMNLIK
ncbi:AsnC family transcriptional regulator [Candidatus Pacearchaeota archaeon]|nr:AsnC family transcriptional regulator [Candidatus Pacearchaeota archaeon]